MNWASTGMVMFFARQCGQSITSSAMLKSPSPNQKRITERVAHLLKAKDAPMAELWREWKRESSACADEFVLVLIGQICSTNALLRLRRSDR